VAIAVAELLVGVEMADVADGQTSRLLSSAAFDDLLGVRVRVFPLTPTAALTATSPVRRTLSAPSSILHPQVLDGRQGDRCT
jgi:hypothetical protein